MSKCFKLTAYCVIHRSAFSFPALLFLRSYAAFPSPPTKIVLLSR